MCGIWCGHRCCTLLLYLPYTLGSGFRIMSLTCGARGTRTPGPLLANRWQHVHRHPSPQLTVLERAPGSVRIRVGCCTFLLYSPAGSAAVQERCSTACRVSRFLPPLRVMTGGLRWPVAELILLFCRCERVPPSHSYAEASIFIRDQQCRERYVAGRWYPTLGWARSMLLCLSRGV